MKLRKLGKLGKLVCVVSVFQDGFIRVKLDVDFHYLLTYYYLRYVDISSSTSKFTQTPSIIKFFKINCAVQQQQQQHILFLHLAAKLSRSCDLARTPPTCIVGTTACVLFPPPSLSLHELLARLPTRQRFACVQAECDVK